ncbi:rod shape-determining protein MreC [Synechococcales cyanobacterium C]|uniref:Cell shape-determining protein MreC n=1 Tax=Petrachloros mirabilis ULC683 TaxID=2781853 RepID=A0A8K1ZXF0_9CYAN|nr:rod shape-determining protein MreC [Petrachloros mirabilis]NCJ05657.1 rod shape-determining protein MreC [Petrachloros mirabilis ULC683]
MYFLYRWWGRYRVVVVLTLLCIALAWSIRRTEGAGIVELYRLMTLPVQPNTAKQEQLINARTWELQQRLQELEARNQALQSLLEDPQIQQDRAISAAVIGRSADHWWHQITLGRGSQDGIQVGAVVAAPGGLVGRVTQVSPHTSRVLLVSDPSSRLGVTISRSRRMGILRGQDERVGRIDFFEKDPDVREGDIVVTSTLSRLFPPGVPVGQIQELQLDAASGPQAVVEFSVPIANLEWVSIYLDGQTSEALVTSEP